MDHAPAALGGHGGVGWDQQHAAEQPVRKGNAAGANVHMHLGHGVVGTKGVVTENAHHTQHGVHQVPFALILPAPHDGGALHGCVHAHDQNIWERWEVPL